MIRCRLPFCLFAFSVIGWISGCGQPTESPTSESSYEQRRGRSLTSVSEALKKLTSLRNTIRDSFAAGDSEAAHDPLHEVGEVIEAIPALAAKEKLSAEQILAVTSQTEVLMDLFGAVDGTMHGQVGPAYADVSRQIDEAVEKLNAACVVVPSPPSKIGLNENGPDGAVLQSDSSEGEQSLPRP